LETINNMKDVVANPFQVEGRPENILKKENIEKGGEK